MSSDWTPGDDEDSDRISDEEFEGERIDGDRFRKLEHILPELAKKDISGVAAHPHRPGFLAGWGMDNNVGLLRP